MTVLSNNQTLGFFVKKIITFANITIETSTASIVTLIQDNMLRFSWLVARQRHSAEI
jgi:hypothetical protein